MKHNPNQVVPVKRLGIGRIDSPIKKHRHALDHKEELFVCEESRVLQQNVFCKKKPKDDWVVFKKLCHFLKLLKTGMMHYGNYI